MDTLINRINKYHIENLEDIKKYLTSPKKDIANFSKYIIENPHITYNFLPKEWRHAFFSSSVLLNLLKELEKSIYQTKNICFPIVNGEAHIVFKNKSDFNFEQDLLMDCDILEDNEGSMSIYFLKDMTDFISHHSCEHIKKIKEHFFHHMEMYGEESAIDTFQERKEFDKSWIEEYNNDNNKKED